MSGLKPARRIALLALVGGLLFTCVTPSPEGLPGKPSHYSTGGFRNPQAEREARNVFTFLQMRYFGDQPFADQESNAGKVPVSGRVADLTAPASTPQVTWLGHSTFLIRYRGINILTDPILSDRASPVSFAGPRRLVAKPVRFEHLPRIDYVIVSHNHYDHLDEDTIRRLGNGPVYLAPLELTPWFRDIGIAPDRVIEFDWWDSRRLAGITITVTPSQHWSGRGLFDRYETLWAAWHVRIDDFTFWFAGDTGYNPHQFVEIGERMGPVDLALIPIGAYAPRWFMKKHHVNPDEAIRIHHDVRARLSIGMHWGTFQLSAEEIDAPMRLIRQASAIGRANPGQFITLAIGETRPVPSTRTPPETAKADGASTADGDRRDPAMGR